MDFFPLLILTSIVNFLISGDTNSSVLRFNF